MSTIQINRDEIHFGASLTLRLERIPRSDQASPVDPAASDTFALHLAGTIGQVSSTILCRKTASIYVCVGQREAVCLSMTGRSWKPNAIKVGFGQVNAISGAAWDLALSDQPRDYLVCPPESSLAGGHLAPARSGQFVAPSLVGGNSRIRLGSDRSVLQVAVYEPRPGLWADSPDSYQDPEETVVGEALPRPLHLGASDEPPGIEKTCRADMWDLDSVLQVSIELLNSRMYRELTGQAPPLAACEYEISGAGTALAS